MVESACKWLIQQRFKGVGMRWSEDGFNHLLHLRLAWVNGRFDDLFFTQSSPSRAYAPAVFDPAAFDIGGAATLAGAGDPADRKLSGLQGYFILRSRMMSQ